MVGVACAQDAPAQSTLIESPERREGHCIATSKDDNRVVGGGATHRERHSDASRRSLRAWKSRKPSWLANDWRLLLFKDLGKALKTGQTRCLGRASVREEITSKRKRKLKKTGEQKEEDSKTPREEGLSAHRSRGRNILLGLGDKWGNGTGPATCLGHAKVNKAIPKSMEGN